MLLLFVFIFGAWLWVVLPLVRSDRLFPRKLYIEVEMPIPTDLAKAFHAIPELYRQYWQHRLPEITEVWVSLPPNVPQELMDVSIRGRTALAITCFERYCQSLQVGGPWLDQVMGKLWEFVESDRLDEWETDIVNMTAEVMNAVDDQREPANREMASLPASARQMLCTLINDIGRGNLYAGTLGYSLDTLWPTLIVLKQALEAGIPIPDLAPFRRSSFSESRGWGNRVPRSFFRG